MDHNTASLFGTASFAFMSIPPSVHTNVHLMAAMATEPSSSRDGMMDGTPISTDELMGLASQLGRLTDTQSIGQRLGEARGNDAQRQRKLEAALLEQASTYLKLHNELQSSKALLGELETFLDIFYTDLSVLSNQMSALQGKSIILGQRLKNRRQLEGKLRSIVADIVLEPRYIDLIFADEASTGRAGLEVWKGCAERLSTCLMACAELEGVLRDELHLSRGAQLDVKALREAREVAEGCRIMAVSKIRPLLISTFAPLRSSLSTNMPVLQAVLLKSYRPLFMFLSHHAPRVAIDVQRAYVAAARLYFETGFRRYERSLVRLRDREKAKAGETAVRTASFTEPASKSGAAVSTLFGSNSSASSDPWAPDTSQLENAKVADGPAVTLAYLADDANYRCSIEALFRSLSLTFLDNASSEYCFLARFFEGIDLDVGQNPGAKAGSMLGSQTSGSSAVKVRHADAEEDEGPLPEESASAKGDDDEDPNDGTAAISQAAQGTVVRLSDLEKARIRGRGAIDELWKQVMEPVVGTYTSFVNSIVALHLPLIPLYTMLKLNDRLLAELEERGVASVLQGTLMAFKLNAWPMLQKQFDDAIESVKRLRTGAAGGGGSGVAAAATNLLGGFGGLFGGQQSSGSGNVQESGTAGVVQLVCGRYAHLYSSIVQLNSQDEEGQDAMLFASLGRLRTEIEGVLDSIAKQTAAVNKGAPPSGSAQSNVVPACHQLIRSTLETGPAAVSLPRIQTEMSHWAEAERNRRLAG